MAMRPPCGVCGAEPRMRKRSRCRRCHNVREAARNRRYREAHPERLQQWNADRRDRSRRGAPIERSEAVKESQRAWFRRQWDDPATRAEMKKRRKAWRDENPERIRAAGLRKCYGIELDEYAAMFDAQAGLCAICHQPETRRCRGRLTELAVDHCHSTGVVRGLLCRRCNSGIGYFRDDPDTLRRVVAYLHATPPELGPAGERPTTADWGAYKRDEWLRGN